MPYLNDTNILLRWVQPNHPLNRIVQAALDVLQERGEAMFITPQNVIEFWNSATRRTSGDTRGSWPSIPKR